MESWLMDMEYPAMNEDMDVFLSQLKSVSTAKTKKVWKHIVAHVRPRKEVEVIKKQCLLHRLSSATPPHFNIEVRLNSIKDLECYLDQKKDLSSLKKIKQLVEEKKRTIMEQLHKLELARKNSLIEEELIKESVYKLNHLKNKKKTVDRNIKKFESDAKVLKILRTSPNRFVHYGAEVSDWERKVLMYVSELPSAIEFETILMKMGELLESSQFPALPLWDRTKTLTEMENLLSCKLRVLNERKLESEEIDKDLEGLQNNITELLAQRNIVKEDEFRPILEGFEQRIFKEVQDVEVSLIETKPPYILESERHTIRRFNHLIEAKAKDVGKFLPLENGDCNSNLPTQFSEISIPVRPQIDKLINSVSTEINCFMDLVVRPNLPDHMINYIQPCNSSYHQLLQINNAMKMHSKLMVLEEKIHNLNLPIIDILEMGDGLNKMNEMHSHLSGKMKCVKSEIETLENVYDRVKEAFNFLRKQPLNENLMGLMIEDKDISYWLKRFSSAKKKHDHELWLLNNQLE